MDLSKINLKECATLINTVQTNILCLHTNSSITKKDKSILLESYQYQLNQLVNHKATLLNKVNH